MRLKTLEIKGFKSFADKTVINFAEDVIGIVGSNGCGKSNIVDSIKWVLGEQKTSALRSDSMTSVIFNGTKSRPAAGMAEVTLVFENNKGVLPSEYTEVAIKRALYKDGTGEYFLNNVKCRLKDIHNLLNDTGMSSDSYAIISLNMVDDLLQDKENARLALFEQAAGISKYKARKKETLSKLRATDEDLTRVEDLLAEVEKNLQSLEKQAQRTKKYLQLKDEYRQTSVEWTKFQIAAFKTSYKTLESQLQRERLQVEQLQTRVAQLETDLQTEKSKYASEEQQLAEAQRNFNQTTGRIKGRENDHKILTQKTLFIQDNNSKLHDRIRHAQQRIAQLEKDYEQYNAQLASEQQILGIYQQDLQDAKTMADHTRSQHASMKSELDVFVKQNAALQNQIFDAEKQIAIFQSKTDHAHQQIRHIEQQIANKQAENAQLMEQAQPFDQQILQLDTQLHEARTRHEAHKVSIEQTQHRIELLRDELAQLNRTFDAKQNEYKLLKGLVESLEGFSESIKFLNKDKSWSNNAPLFSDIIYCQPDYRTAIEGYLDNYLSYYVVRDTQEAVQAIQLLDRHNKGKANFFVLEYLPASTDISSASSAPVGTPALSVVEADALYSPLIANLLHDVYIVESAADIPTHDTTRVYLTRNGKFTQKAYTLRGGSVGAFEGKKIGRKKDLELLEKQLSDLSTQVQTSKNNLQQAQTDLQQLRTVDYQRDITRLEQQSHQLQRQYAVIKSKLDNFQTQIQEFQTQIEAQRQQATQHTAQIELSATRLATLKTELQQAQTLIQDKESSFRQVADELTRTAGAYNQKNIELVRQQNKVAALQKELDFARRQTTEAHTQLQADQAALGTSQTEITDVEADIAKVQIEIQELYTQRKEFQTQLEQLEKSYFQQRGNINHIEDDIRQTNRQYQQGLQLIAQLEQQFSQVKMQLTSLGERLNVEFEININDIFNDEPDTATYSADELETQVSKLRQRVQNFGAVNYMAVEAYDETKTRFDFITEQRNDLLQAKETLLKTLSEIEHVATDMFMTAFATVRTHFISVFRSLFEEDDTCDLLLTDAQNPLESRIEIIAKPKGKKPLSINQLSGGEKTLTATALLFALYLLKPAPFCVFDEVDAPLDDANIAKFNNIVRDFAQNSQFIVVTHNKKTMESVNIMYGVTMVQGVSRVVPVDFRTFATTTA